MKKDKRKHKYLVGYQGEGQVAYSKSSIGYLELLTFGQAKKEIVKLKSHRSVSVIYELVPVVKLKTN